MTESRTAFCDLTKKDIEYQYLHICNKTKK